MAGLRYLLDSNILSEPSRPRPDAGVQSRLQSHRHEVCTAAPILHELHFGLARMPQGARKQQLTRYLDQVLRQLPAILPYDREAARSRLFTPPHGGSEGPAPDPSNGLEPNTAILRRPPSSMGYFPYSP